MGKLYQSDELAEAVGRLPGVRRGITPERLEKLRKTEEDAEVIWNVRITFGRLMQGKFFPNHNDHMEFAMRKNALLLGVLAEDD